MKNPLHRPEDHPSYKLHRKQMWTQILLPIMIAGLLFISFIIVTSLATFRGNGDVSRWAAISTIWLVLPVLIAGLILLILMITMVYLLSRFTNIIPPYSHQAQQIFYRIEGTVKHYALLFRKPGRAVQEIMKLVREYIENVRKASSG
jgi:predicted PurR-regulated permease PerM